MTTETEPLTVSDAVNPAAAQDDPRALTLANVERALDEVRPSLMADGGNVEVV